MPSLLDQMSIKTQYPPPYVGPDRAALARGYWKQVTVASAAPCAPGEPPPAEVAVEAGDSFRDAGYLGSSQMVVECALCIALQV